MVERYARMPNLDQASCEIERDKTRGHLTRQRRQPKPASGSTTDR